MANLIQIKRGNKSDLPTFHNGEPGFTIDTHEVFIGTSTNNIRILTEDDLYTNSNVDSHLSGGTGINYNSGTISTDDVNIDHNSLKNYDANKHVDHAVVSVFTSGIISGGGDLTADRTITLNHSDVDHDQTTNYNSTQHFIKESINALYQPNETNPFVYTDNSNNLHIDGDIVQNGDTYETHAEKLYTTKDLIITREEATTAIASGDISGLEVTKYDGTNNLLFGTDLNGYFKVGESGSLQILATREDSPNDTSLAFWNSTEERYDTSSNLTWNGTDLKISSNTVATETWVSNNITKSTLNLDTTNNVQFGSLGIGTTATGTTGEIVATDDITAFYSDERLKSFSGKINFAVEKIKSINGYYFQPNDLAESFGYTDKSNQVGVNAQELQKVLPEVVRLAPFDRDVNGQSKSGENYLTVKYEKIVPLLIEAIKEQQKEIEELKNGTPN